MDPLLFRIFHVDFKNFNLPFNKPSTSHRRSSIWNSSDKIVGTIMCHSVVVHRQYPSKRAMNRPLFYILSILVIFLGTANRIFDVVVFVDAAKIKIDSDNKNKPQVPIHALQKAIQYVTQTVSDGKERLRILQDLDKGNVHTLYTLAKELNQNDNPDDTITSMELWHALADTGDHILSQVALGFAYAENDPSRAIVYFVEAGENGPHQSALYNAGPVVGGTTRFCQVVGVSEGCP
jgi:hypothetical protein